MATCAACAGHARALERVEVAVRIASSPDAPDLSTRILAEMPEPSLARTALRVVLLASAFALIAMAVPELVGEPHHGPGYRHLAAIDLAVAVGLVWTALRPARALSGFLPIATVLVVGCIAILASEGQPTLHVANHTSAVVDVSAAWLLGLPPRRRRAPALRLTGVLVPALALVAIAAPGRLQFKVLQTYANGDVDRWISEWPLGAPEPDQPGPVLDLVEGAPGTVPPTSDPTTPTSPPETPTSAPPTTATAPAGDDEEGDGVAVLPIALGVIVVGGGAFWWWLRRRRP